MAVNLSPITVTSSITLDQNTGVYLIATISSLTLTLPNIDSNGISYIISNFLNNNGVTVTSNVPNFIRFTDDPADDVTSFVMKPVSVVEITSYENVWIVTSTTNISSSGVASLASCTCNSNNSNPYTLCDGGRDSLITRVTMNSNLPPTTLTICINNISAGPTLKGEFLVSSDAAMTTKIISIPISNVASGFSLLSNSILLNSTTYSDSYYVGWKRSGGNASDKIGICSVRLT